MKAITNSNFNEFITSDEVRIIKLGAEWCGPCKTISPILDEISNDLDNNLQIAKINIDENPETPQKYNVRSVPTLLLFKDGEVVASKVGAISKSQLLEWIKEQA